MKLQLNCDFWHRWAIVTLRLLSQPPSYRRRCLRFCFFWGLFVTGLLQSQLWLADLYFSLNSPQAFSFLHSRLCLLLMIYSNPTSTRFDPNPLGAPPVFGASSFDLRLVSHRTAGVVLCGATLQISCLCFHFINDLQLKSPHTETSDVLANLLCHCRGPAASRW